MLSLFITAIFTDSVKSLVVRDIEETVSPMLDQELMRIVCFPLYVYFVQFFVEPHLNISVVQQYD